ncbi:hypothetical protein N9891_02030 [bacterium]|nr:hypothetical protein [bacterium]
MKTLTTISALTALSTVFALTSCKSGESSDSAAKEDSPGKQLLAEAIDAHGGIEKWRDNGLLKFRWTYHMTDRGAGAVVDTVQTVDPVSLAVVHTKPDSNISFGRTAEGKYWVNPPETKVAPPVQFWSLTPTWFLGIPFVFDDAQINAKILDEPKAFEGKDYTQVKLTYNSTAGESPDDYYVLLLDPETKVVRGAYYTVTNPLVYKGGPVTPKFITLDNLQEIDGLMLAGGHKTYSMTDGVIGDQMRYTDVSEVAFIPRKGFDFTPPEGAQFLDPVPSAEKAE